MNAGNVEQFDTPEQVYNKPASLFFAGFIGSPPMNLLKQAPGVPKIGHTLHIKPLEDKIHWFDAQTKKRLER